MDLKTPDTPGSDAPSHPRDARDVRDAAQQDGRSRRPNFAGARDNDQLHSFLLDPSFSDAEYGDPLTDERPLRNKYEPTRTAAEQADADELAKTVFGLLDKARS